MYIYVNKANECIKNVESIINEYEENSYNYYKVILDNANDWNTPRLKYFCSIIEVEKNNSHRLIYELNLVKDLYKFIVSSYSKFGDNVIYDDSLNDKVLSDINDRVNDLENIIVRYREVINNHDFNVRNNLSLLMKMKGELLDTKDNLKETINNLKEVKEEIKLKISSIHIDKFKEQNEFGTLGSCENIELKIFFDSVIEKLSYYSNIEIDIIRRFNIELDFLDRQYNISSKFEIKNIELDLLAKLGKYNKVHFLHIKTLSEYYNNLKEELSLAVDLLGDKDAK